MFIMEPWIIWLIIAALLVVIEILTQMVWTLCLAVGCIGAIIADMCGADTAVQIGTMAVVSVIAFIFLLPLFKRWHESRQRHSNTLTGMDALLGRSTALITELNPGSTGRVKIDGDNWQVISPRLTHSLDIGTSVTVTGYDGNILTVEPTTNPLT